MARRGRGNGLGWIVAAAVLGALGSEARAGLIQVSSRSALGGNDLISWAGLGTSGSDVANPFTINSTNGISTTVSKQLNSGVFQILQQGAPGGWGGNFSPGEMILWTKSFSDASPKAITFDFASAITGLGMNFQQANALATFTATMDAFDASGTYLGGFSATGASNTNNDGSAVFLGLKSDTTNIRKVVISLSAAPFNAIGSYGINQISLLTPAVAPPSGNAVPEPATLAPAALAVVGLVALRRKRKTAC